jgi:hypothetical protein
MGVCEGRFNSQKKKKNMRRTEEEMVDNQKATGEGVEDA